jgi:hypothetical protein
VIIGLVKLANYLADKGADIHAAAKVPNLTLTRAHRPTIELNLHYLGALAFANAHSMGRMGSMRSSMPLGTVSSTC